MYITSITKKGQATIPLVIRKKLGLKLQGKVAFAITAQNEVVVKPVPDFFALKGSVSPKKPVNDSAMDQAVEQAVGQSYGTESD